MDELASLLTVIVSFTKCNNSFMTLSVLKIVLSKVKHKNEIVIGQIIKYTTYV